MFTNVSEMFAGISETSVNFYQTAWHNNPEDSELYILSRQNLKSQNHPCALSAEFLRFRHTVANTWSFNYTVTTQTPGAVWLIE
jgi:hypothetical protein